MSPWRYWSTLLLSRTEWIHPTWCSLVHRGLWLTDCSESWMLQCTLSVEHASTTVDCHSFYMSTCIGSMWSIGSSLNSRRQFTGVWTTKRRITWPTAASWSPVSQSCWSSAVAISPTSPSWRTTAPPHHTWPSVLRCRRSHCLEFVAWQH